MRYYINILPGKNFVYGRPSCTVPLFRSGVVMMTTLDHAVEEECRSILFEEEEGKSVDVSFLKTNKSYISNFYL